MASRKDHNDFQEQVQSKGRTIQAGKDGTYQISKAGVVTHSKVFYTTSGGARTDANPQGDRVLVFDPGSGTGHISDAQLFIDSLR